MDKAVNVADQSTDGVRRRRSTGEGARRADRMREIILDVALDSFSAAGFIGTSTRSIAKLAGVQHSLVNYHFKNKEMLWIAVMDRVLCQLTDLIDEAIGEDPNRSASEKLRLFIEIYAKTAASSPQAFRILTQQSTQASERLDWLMERYLREQFKQITGLIADGQAEGTVIEGDPAHVFFLILGCTGTYFAATRGYTILTGKDPASAAEMHRLISFICSVVFKGK
ncbi:TetR/AcrR family transcriptional regulator [Sphingobium sp.]|uniref:TetR/AcrR family transcriptional regulator n=1 Tax=Sphingobium sp. TaxID=1912891 RepID=UPI0028BD9782|nr:TetR/AcrR family transcriptional regulator [Sphingobium sp.]